MPLATLLSLCRVSVETWNNFADDDRGNLGQCVEHVGKLVDDLSGHSHCGHPLNDRLAGSRSYSASSLLVLKPCFKFRYAVQSLPQSCAHTFDVAALDHGIPRIAIYDDPVRSSL